MILSLRLLETTHSQQKERKTKSGSWNGNIFAKIFIEVCKMCDSNYRTGGKHADS